MSIEFFNEDIFRPEIDFRMCKKWIDNVVKKEKYVVSDISIIFCSDAYLLQINQQYLNHNYYTDIVTFDYSEKGKISGDLFISIDTVESNSKKFSTNFMNELHRVIIHGILHLLGYNDKSEDETVIMRKKEDQYLSLLETL